MTTPCTRRQALGVLASGAVAATALTASGARAQASRETVVVITDHNDDTFSLFEEAFERAQLRYRLKFIWMMPPDATRYLRRAGSPGADLWWQASPRNHVADIVPDGLLQPLGVPLAGLPDQIGDFALTDARGLYHATQLTAFSFLVNPQALAAQHLPWPDDWAVLTQAAYAGKVALSEPSQVRFGSTLLDVALRAGGWQQGWAWWSAIAGNAVLLPRGLTDEVSSGRQPVALHLDIVPNAEQRYRQPLTRVYPRHGALVNAGFIGMMAGSTCPEGARAFASFVLSDAGQALLVRTDLPRLPVRPSAYGGLGAGQFNPFAAQQRGELVTGVAVGAGRAPVIETLFGAMVSDHAGLSRLWWRLHQAEARRVPRQAAALAQARRLLERVPLTEAEAGSPAVRDAFRQAFFEPQPQRRGPGAAGAASAAASAVPGAASGTASGAAGARPAQEGPPRTVLSDAARSLAARWREAFQQAQAQADAKLREVGA